VTAVSLTAIGVSPLVVLRHIMPSITGNVGSTAQHIPAWKKLGLKLKSAKELAIHSEDSSNNEAKSKKRKVADDETAVSEVESVKKHRPKHAIIQTSPAPTLSAKEPPETSVKNGNSNGADPSSIPLATPPRKRKSVAFTPDTKLEDGDSTKQLFCAWVAEQIAKDSSFNPQWLGRAFQTFEPRSIPEPGTEEKVTKIKSKKKKEKFTQNTDTQTVPSTSSTEHEPPTHPAVTYLQQYHAARPTWKFNKAKQTYILKNLFDIDALPPSLDPALTAYIEGLQGADARTRVQQAAEQIRDEDAKAKQAVQEENMEDPVRRQEYYDGALKAYQAQLKGQVEEQGDLARELDSEWRLRILKRKRAERILWSMSDTLRVTDHAAPEQQRGPLPGVDRGPLPGVDRGGADGGSGKRLKTNDGTARRRRKRRTGLSADEKSSSSSGSSSSSSSSSSDDSGESSSSDSETSSESEEGTDSSDSSSSSSAASSSSSSSGNSSNSGGSDQGSSDSEGSSNSD